MPEYYEFEVSLSGVEPRIWRRFLLPLKGSTFADLHKAIQDACGWWNYHMFEFRLTRGYEHRIAGIPSDEDFDMFGSTVKAADLVPLRSFFGKEYKRCLYEYDFGDSWFHDVKLLRVIEFPETFRRRLVGGERAFPHEDCGGVSGYERCVDFIRTGIDTLENDPKGFREWLEGWHPESFDIEATKAEFDQDILTRKKGTRRPSRA